MLRLPRELTYSVPWNLWLLTAGSLIFAVGYKAVAVPYGLLSGGFSGIGLLLYYLFPAVSPGTWYLLLNVPVFALGFRLVSRRFGLYSLYGMLALTVCIDVVPWHITLENTFLAVLAGGTLMGVGNGIILRSLGSAGGTDIIAVVLNQRYNWRMGQVNFAFNFLLFAAGLAYRDVNLMLYSLAMVAITAWSMEHVLGMFNERKTALIISQQHEAIRQAITVQLHRGVTVLHGQGGYTGAPKEILLTVVNNIQLKRLEQIIYTIDPKAFTIFGNTFNVLGEGFSRRKTY